jgi:two-component system, cell cycle sensor histidine kinase and response regulator CckA
VVITDLTMPEMTGDILAWEIKKIRPDIPVILCTGLQDEEGEAVLFKYGVDAFIQKPYGKEMLIENIQKMLNRTKGK